MLEHYSVKNFMSFKNYTEFDFTATEYPVLQETNTENGILKGGLFVGGNASGKTNAVTAIRFLLNVLFLPAKVNWKPFVCLFSKSNLIDLQYDFCIEGHSISYRLCYQKVKSSIKIKEGLSLDKKAMLNRNGANAWSKLSDRKEFNQIPEESIFLRDIWFNTQFRDYEILQKWFSFLENSIYANPLLGGMGVYKQHETPVSLNDYLDTNGVEALNEFLNECGFSYYLRYDAAQAKRDSKAKYAGLYLVRNEIKLKKGIPMDYESMGNQILMNMLPPYLYVIEHGGILIIDEFSSGLHNDLERLLVQYFMKHSGNAQLFLVSHSTNLLSSGLFRPDQLYAVNFDENGSNIVRFSDRGARVSQNLEKMYLSGIFSGVPHYRDASEWGRDNG